VPQDCGSPQAKGRIERLFGTLQDRLVKEMRLQQMATLEQANRFLELTFWPSWQQRFARQPAIASDAHRASSAPRTWRKFSAYARRARWRPITP
jgi:hypothetical protein